MIKAVPSLYQDHQLPPQNLVLGQRKGGSGSATVTPPSRLGNNQSEAVGSYHLADMLDRQNNLILELLSKHEQLSMSLQEVRS